MAFDKVIAQRLLATHTPDHLQQYIPEFVGATPSPDAGGTPTQRQVTDTETGVPIDNYEPYADNASLIGSFMMYCSASCYFASGPEPTVPDQEG
jgi:hypothetical protein